MEKILATPEAYELIKINKDTPAIKSIFAVAAAMAQKKYGEIRGHFSVGVPLAVAVNWSSSPHETSAVLIYKHDGYSEFFGPPELHVQTFRKLSKNAVPVSE